MDDYLMPCIPEHRRTMIEVKDTKKEFQPEYFTGLPQDVKRAKKYIGKVMEFSAEGDNWYIGIFESVDKELPRIPAKYRKKNSGIWYFIRTCPETFKPETRYIKFGPGQIPAPETVEPENGTKYFYLSSSEEEGYGWDVWRDSSWDNFTFKNGIYLKEEHVKEAVSVIRGIMGRAE